MTGGCTRASPLTHDIEDAYDLLTGLRIETAAGFARADRRLDSMDSRLGSHDYLLERIVQLLDNPGGI